ncbi:MAG: hypothetical protein AABM29_09325 [Actinomycetota bacterium]
MEAAGGTAELVEYERRFRQAGLPLFIEDRSAREDIFNRAAPFLGIVFVGEMLGAGQLDWSWWQNLLAVGGGLAVLLVAFGLLNLARGRSFRAIPDRLGYAELAGFVLIPATLPLIFGGQAGSALGTIAANLGFLLLVYAVVGLGLLSLLRWVLGRLVEQLTSALSLAAKAVPLLTIFVLLTFVTQELWLILTRENLAVYAVTIGLFFVLGSAFLVVRVPREARVLEGEAGEGTPPLKRPQLFNVGLVMFVSQGVQVIIVSLVVASFLVAFGLLTVDASIQAEWAGKPVNQLLSFNLFGERLELTEEMLRVAGGLAAFSGFYFAVAMLTDSTYREEFLTELTEEMRQSFRARAEYLRLRGGAAASG